MRGKTDLDVLKQEHRFVWDDADDKMAEKNWEVRLAKRYYDKLYKEYCIVDLSNYKQSRNSIGLRWRIEREVLEGKGQFSCGERHCQDKESLTTWEVNFGYKEQGERKNALVKLRLCQTCAMKLNYHHKRKQVRVGKETRLVTNRKETNPPNKKVAKKRKSSERTGDNTETDQSEDKVTDQEAEGVPEELSVWTGPAKMLADKTKEDEFDEYLEDMFL
jgi:protein FRA10AC1